MRVVGLSVTPVKGTRLQSVEEVELGRTGAVGNREFFVIDERDRMLNAKQLGDLQRVLATLDDGELQLTFGDRIVAGAPRPGPPVRARFFSRIVQGRVVEGPFAAALSEFIGQELRVVHAPGAVDRGARGAVSLISRASLEALASAAGVESVDGRRFRMLIEVDGPEPHQEDEWVGRVVRIGSDVRVRFRGHAGRCLVTSREPETGMVDLPTLDVLRDYRGSVVTTEPLPFGIYGEVIQEGTIAIGDRLDV